MKKHKFGWKQALLIAAAVVLLTAGGFAIRALIKRGAAPAQTVTEPTVTEPTVTEQAETTDVPEETQKPPAWELSENQIRANRFVTYIVQQNIMDTKTDLDEDAELIRFVFGYRRANDKDSVIEQQDNGVSCRTLTLEQVNETLTYFFGKTISPDREDYSIMLDENESFNCFFRDGCFWNVPPYPTEKYSFPIRFALVESVDEETCTLYFRLYQINPEAWGIGEAERHVPIMPMLSLQEADRTDRVTKDWYKLIAHGKAVLRDLGDELQLLELSCE